MYKLYHGGMLLSRKKDTKVYNSLKLSQSSVGFHYELRDCMLNETPISQGNARYFSSVPFNPTYVLTFVQGKNIWETGHFIFILLSLLVCSLLRLPRKRPSPVFRLDREDSIFAHRSAAMMKRYSAHILG